MRKSVFCLVFALAIALSACASLHTAAREGDVDGVRAMLAKGTDPNSDEDGRGPPICSAVMNEHEEIVRILLEAKADPNVDCTFIHDDIYPLIDVAAWKRGVAIFEMLLAKGADAHRQGRRHPFLFQVLTDERPNPYKIVEAYLKHLEKTEGSARVLEEINRSTEGNWTPFARAALDGNILVLDRFLEHGADPNAMIADGEGDEWPVLFLAKVSGNEYAPKLLLKKGAFGSSTTKNGLTYDEAAAKLRATLAAARRQKEELQGAKRAEEAEERREARETAQRQAAQNQAMWNRLSGQTPSNNPLDDNSFQERMRAHAQHEQQRKEAMLAQRSAPPSSAAPANAPTAGSEPSPRAATAEAQPQARKDDDDAKKKEDARKREAEAKRRDAAENASKDKADREAKEAAAKEAAAKKRAAYLEANRRGIRLKAGTCPGSKDYLVIGTRPDQNLCINVTYRATCATNQGASTGVLRNFTGGGSCGGDTQVISPKPSCKVDEVTVTVDDVQLCSP